MRLEPLEERHAPGLLAAATPELFRFTPQAPKEWSVDGFAADITRVRGLANVVPFATVLVQTGQVIGRTTYMDIQEANKGLEIGRTWIGKPWQGTAVNPEQKLLLMRHAFETLGAIRVQYTTGGTNLHSQAAIAKLGAVREGVLRRNRILPDGAERDTVVFSVIRAEWPGVRARLEDRLSAFPG